MRYTAYSGIREFRRSKSMTQLEMASIMECHINSYYLYETGKVEMPVSKAKKVAMYFDIDRWTLYED